MIGAMSNPSSVTLGISAPASLTIVGNRSSVAASCSVKVVGISWFVRVQMNLLHLFSLALSSQAIGQ